jgi:WD40 repeat protein
MPFKAFISYSHAADGKLAPAVQHALHRIAKPWYRLRSMRVFRDQTNLSTSPGLWTSIESALKEAEFFLFMASPKAAQSVWVQKEVSWWLENRSWKTFLIVLTDGEILWNEAARDVNWAVTTALPRSLSGAFPEEPLYTDLRWARSGEQLSPRHTQFRSAILDLASTLLARPKDELDGDDVRQYRRTKRVAWSAGVALALLFVAALLAAVFATRQSLVATSRALGARSEALLPTNPELALLLAREAVRFNADEQAEFALRQAFVRNPRRLFHQTGSGQVAAAFSGADFVIAAEAGKRASVWSVGAGKKVSELPFEAGDRLMISQSPDRAMVALQSADYMNEPNFTVYDGNTWRPVATLQGGGARFSRDGKVLTAVEGRKIRQWFVPSLREREVAATLPENYVLRDVSPDGSQLFLAQDQEGSTSVVVQAQSGATTASLPELVLSEGSGFSPDGAMVAAARKNDTVIEFWDTQTGGVRKTLEKPDPDNIGWTSYVTFSPDGKLFAAGNRAGRLHVWNVADGKLMSDQSAHRNWVTRIEFSPDGKAMLTVGSDGTARLWDTGGFRSLVTLGGKGDDAWDIGFASDSSHFLTTHLDGTARVWRREVWYPELSIPAKNAVVSEDGSLVVGEETLGEDGNPFAPTQSGPARVWDGETGKLKTTLAASAAGIERFAVNLPASLIAAAPGTGPVRLWNARTGERGRQLSAATAEASAIAFDPAGARLASGDKNGDVRIWSVPDGRLLARWQALKGKDDNTILSLAFHPDGQRIAVTTWGGWASLRDSATGAVSLEAKLDEEDQLAQWAAFNPAGDLFFFGGDRFPQIWNTKKKERVQTLAGHNDEVLSGAFSPDGRLALTGSGFRHANGEPPEDGNAAHLWDLRMNRQLLYLPAGWAVRAVAFAKTGTKIFTISEDSLVRRYACDVCLPLPALLDLVSSVTARDLTAEERARYLPQSALLDWIVRVAPGANSLRD